MKPVITQSLDNKFSELELCFTRYFNAQIMPVMNTVQADLHLHQVKETAEYMNSVPGMITMGNSQIPGMGAMQVDTVLRHTGEWNSKTAEDYLSMCQERIGGAEYIQEDLSKLTDMWRREVIDLIGREQYDAKSQALGHDLAEAYVSYRMDTKMLDYLVKQNTPKSSMEYILRKGMNESLLGLVTLRVHDSPLEAHILEQSEKAYGPTLVEQTAGNALAFYTDVMTTCGYGSWASVGKLAATEVVFQGGAGLYEYFTSGEAETSVEEYISKGVFGQDYNVMASFQDHSRRLLPENSETVKMLDESMDGRMKLLDQSMFPLREPVYMAQSIVEQTEEVHAPFLPGVDPNHPERYVPPSEEEPQNNNDMTENGHQEGQTILAEEVAQPAPQQGTDGWGNMLSTVGLSDLGTVGKNMGYVISMLPDVMLGLFTGKTKSLGLKDNMLPLASILVGMFVRNPLLKMVLIGMGGMNLLNKAGHEAIENQKIADGVVMPDGRQYKQYADEPLNARIQNPEVKGNALFAVVDGVPCTVQLPPNAVSAYENGALPLNRLANAVLAKSDEMSRIAQENYDMQEGRGQQIGRGI